SQTSAAFNQPRFGDSAEAWAIESRPGSITPRKCQVGSEKCQVKRRVDSATRRPRPPDSAHFHCRIRHFHLALLTANFALPSRLSCLSSAAPHLESNGRSGEPELVADLVQQEPLVREVKRRRDVREEHERRRRHVG